MSTAQHNALHGKTLEQILTELVAHYQWQGLAERIDVRCFKSNPSIKSSLAFLRKTPWAREKVEQLYVKLQRQADMPRRPWLTSIAVLGWFGLTVQVYLVLLARWQEQASLIGG